MNIKINCFSNSCIINTLYEMYTDSNVWWHLTGLVDVSNNAAYALKVPLVALCMTPNE